MSPIHPTFTHVRALFFDVFGTTVDWRSTVTHFLHTRCQSTLVSSSSTSSIPRHLLDRASTLTETDWGQFTAEWRDTYYVFTKSIAEDDSKKVAYKTIDQHQFDSLQELLQKWEVADLWSTNEIREISQIWHHLNPWPDTCTGILNLNKHFSTSTLSNGNVSLLEDLAQYADLQWTHIFSSEMFGTYKPNPGVYLGAAEKLNLKPENCAMVAAHLGDLKAARGCGFRTVYVEREGEEAWDEEKVRLAKEEAWVDVWVDKREEGFLTVAQRLAGK